MIPDSLDRRTAPRQGLGQEQEIGQGLGSGSGFRLEPGSAQRQGLGLGPLSPDSLAPSTHTPINTPGSGFYRGERGEGLHFNNQYRNYGGVHNSSSGGDGGSGGGIGDFSDEGKRDDGHVNNNNHHSNHDNDDDVLADLTHITDTIPAATNDFDDGNV